MGRDHSAPCPTCGEQCGGLDDVPCACVHTEDTAMIEHEVWMPEHAWRRAWGAVARERDALQADNDQLKKIRDCMQAEVDLVRSFVATARKFVRGEAKFDDLKWADELLEDHLQKNRGPR